MRMPRGQGVGYKYEVQHRRVSLAVIQLQPEQSIQAEAGAMVSMSAKHRAAIADEGGLFGESNALRVASRRLFSTFTSRGAPGEVTFAPGRAGRYSSY